MNNEVEQLLAVYGRNFPAYQQQEVRLEDEHHGEYAVFHDGQLVGVYETVEDAEAKGATAAESREYAIFRIGKEPLRYSDAALTSGTGPVASALLIRSSLSG